MFNDRTLRQLRVSREQFFADGNGLYIRVTPKGKKTFVYRTQKGGKSRWKVLGHYPAMTLLEARNRAAAATGKGFVVPTIGEIFKEYLPRLRQHYRRPYEPERRLTVDVLPRIGQLRVDEVTRRTLSELLQVIVKRGSPVQANRTIPNLRHFFGYCVERGWLEHSPAEGITKKSVGGRERTSSVGLSETELVELIEVLLTERFHPKTRLALGLLLLTGTRSDEVLSVDAAEIAGAWWTIPAERTKSFRTHKVYLSPQSRNLLETAFRYFGVKPFDGMKNQTLAQAIRRTRFSRKFTPHKFRHTMATQLTNMGVAPHITEKMLNHKLEGVFEVYNHAEFLPERRAAWRLWGAYLAKLRRQHAHRMVHTGVVRADGHHADVGPLHRGAGGAADRRDPGPDSRSGTLPDHKPAI